MEEEDAAAEARPWCVYAEDLSPLPELPSARAALYSLDAPLLLAHALRLSASAEGGRSVGASDYAASFDLALAELSRLAGASKTMKVEEVKAWIKGHADPEAASLAARLGKMSKIRNGRAHVDHLLVVAVADMVSRRGRRR